MEASVQSVFDSYLPACQKPLAQIRQLIYEVAAKTPGVGPVEESLKWGQPSYATPQTGAATPIRLGVFGEGDIALFFHCQTTLVESFRTLFHGSDTLRFSKNRAVLLDPSAPLPREELALCIQMALTYHLAKPQK